jgi:hypothetical protein
LSASQERELVSHDGLDAHEPLGDDVLRADASLRLRRREELPGFADLRFQISDLS